MMPAIKRLKSTGATILVSRGMKVLQAAPGSLSLSFAGLGVIVMGVCLGLGFNKKFPEDDRWSKFTDGKSLLYGMSRFDEICADRGVTLFSTLAGPDDDEMERLAVELPEGETLEPTWFTCADGIRTVT